MCYIASFFCRLLFQRIAPDYVHALEKGEVSVAVQRFKQEAAMFLGKADDAEAIFRRPFKKSRTTAACGE